MNKMTTHENILDAVKSLPIVGTLTAKVAGMDLQQWVLVATLIYTCTLIAEKWYKAWKSRHGR